MLSEVVPVCGGAARANDLELRRLLPWFGVVATTPAELFGRASNLAAWIFCAMPSPEEQL